MGVGVKVGVGVGVGVGLVLLASDIEMLSIVSVFRRLKRSVNQLLGAEGRGPALKETVFQAEEASQTTRLL